MHISDILYKPVIIQGGVFGVVFGREHITTDCLNSKGKVQTGEIDVVHYININETNKNETLIVDKLIVTEQTELQSMVEIIDPESNEYVIFTQMVGKTMVIVATEMAEMTNDLNTINSVASSLRSIFDKDNSKNAFVIGDASLRKILRLDYNSLEDEDKIRGLSEEEQRLIADGLTEVVNENINIDTENPLEVTRLKNELQYKIIEVMPNDLTAKDISLNYDIIINEIRKFQKFSNNNFNEDDEDINT